MNEFYSFYLEKFPSLIPDMIIYMRVAPSIALGRFQKRGRPEESKLSIEQLQQLHELHEGWLMRKEIGPLKDVYLLEMDASLPTDLIEGEYERCLKEIFQYRKPNALLVHDLGVDRQAMLSYKRLTENAYKPFKGTQGAAGYDLFRCVFQRYTIF